MGRVVAGSVAGWVAVALALGCERPRTELVVRVDSDVGWGEGERLQSVVLTVRRGSATGPLRSQRSTTLGRGGGRLPLPMWVGVVAADDADTPLWIEALGCGDPSGCTASTALLAQRAVVRFERGQTLEVRLVLASACLGVACAPDQRCLSSRACGPASAAQATVGPFLGVTSPSDPDAGTTPVDAGTPAATCGDGVCTSGAEDCVSCPLDCNRCTGCEMAPSCPRASVPPATGVSLPGCDNTTVTLGERTDYTCGSDLGVAAMFTSCADPLLQIRVKEISIRRGFFDTPGMLYCVIGAADGSHSELLLVLPRAVAGNRDTTRINLPSGQSMPWGQGDLYRSTSNITIRFRCFLTSNAEAAQGALNDIAGRAAMVSQRADGSAWVFRTAAALDTVIGSSLPAPSDSAVLDVRQTIDARALLAMTNVRSWVVRSHRGNLDLSRAWDLSLTMESWGCADGR